MKRLAVLLLSLIALPLFADEERQRTTLIEDVIRMSQAGVNDEAIIDFVERSDKGFELNADDLIALTDAKVSKDVIKAVIDEADERDGARGRGRERVVRSRVVYTSPYWYDPWYDPFWYGPRLSIGFGFGPRYYGGFGRGFHRGGGFGHGRGGRGRGRH